MQGYRLLLQCQTFNRAVMKRTLILLAAGTMAILLSTNGVAAQEAAKSTVTEEKQKQQETQQNLQRLSEEEQQKMKQSEIEAKRKIISEKEMQQKIAEIEAAAEDRARDYERAFREFEVQRIRTDELTKNLPVIVGPNDKVFKYVSPEIYIYGGHGYGSKPGSSWNYSRQVMEASFTNEFTMSVGDESNVNLSVSGDCAEGSITVAIIMPDGKQLSEVLIDANGSLNWRKNFEAGENNGWKNGKWVFKIKAKDATGNLRISMNSD
jgi:hypothetical protein